MDFSDSIEEDSLFVLHNDDDELFELASAPVPRHNVLILPGGESSTSQPPQRATRSRRAERTQQQTEPPQAAAQTEVIDLTDEPDSPVNSRRSTATQTQYWGSVRNPRRTNSLRVSAPRLMRSDHVYIPGPSPQHGTYIDLTTESSPPPELGLPPDDDDDDDLGVSILSTSSTIHTHHHHHHHTIPPAPPERPPAAPRHHFHERPRPDELYELEFISSAPRRVGLPSFSIGIGRTLRGFLGGDVFHFTQPNLDVSRNAFAPRESPKPAMDPIQPARDGFTRNTCAEPEDEETIAICPACHEELAYDPDGQPSSGPSTSKKRKRAAGEHHFWALKKCGHVYCADCFDNRKPSKAKPQGVGFRRLGTSPGDLRCAVDGCETKVANKTEWVGIFL